MNDKCIYCQLKKLMVESKNHLVLCSSDTVYRLIGIADEPEDLYYILRRLNGSILLSSCVGGITDLFYQFDEETYNELNHIFLLNEDICFEDMSDESDKFECCCK